MVRESGGGRVPLPSHSPSLGRRVGPFSLSLCRTERSAIGGEQGGDRAEDGPLLGTDGDRRGVGREDRDADSEWPDALSRWMCRGPGRAPSEPCAGGSDAPREARRASQRSRPTPTHTARAGCGEGR